MKVQHNVLCPRCNKYKRRSPTKSLGYCRDCWLTTGQREKDKRSGKLKVAFPFFRLPLEIRQMIYHCMFQTTRGDQAITPDPTRTRRSDARFYSRHHSSRTISAGLGLLLSCQKAYEEVTDVLYSEHTFYFDDDRHGMRDFDYPMNTRSCYYCRIRQRYSGLFNLYENRCHGIEYGTHYVKIPYCDYVTMFGKSKPSSVLSLRPDARSILRYSVSFAELKTMQTGCEL